MADQPEDNQSHMTDPSASDFLDQLVGEGRKYGSAEELAKAYFHADGFINHLKKESSELREELNKSMKLEDILNTKEQQEKEVTPEAPTDQTPPATPEDLSPVQTAEDSTPDLAAEVRRVLEEEDHKRKTQQNLDSIVSRMKEMYDGDQAKIREHFDRKSGELGVDSDYLLDVAARSPKAFYDLMGLDAGAAKAVGGGVAADTNTAALESHRSNHNSGPKQGTYAYYESMRKSDPKAYFSPRVQQEMMREAQAKGQDFFSN